MIDCPLCGLMHEVFLAIGIPVYECARVKPDRWFILNPGAPDAVEFWAWRE